jgi:rubrerythrin
MTDENDNIDTNESIESLFENVERAIESRRGFLKKGVAASAAGLGLSAGTGSVAASGEGGESMAVAEQDNQQFVDALNYALTLERLEATFYRRGLETFSQSEIESTEFGQNFTQSDQFSVYQRFTEIRDHEVAHVDALVATISDLGGQPLGEGDVEFQFELGSPEAFIETAQVLETTGVSAYDGAIDMLSGSGELLTAAATIATVEGRHSSYLNSLTGSSPFPSAFDEALEPDEVRERIAPFIASQ